MEGLWEKRLKRSAAGLLAVTLASLSVSGILSAAGDQAGTQAMLGAALMTGLCFVIAVSVLAFRINH